MLVGAVFNSTRTSLIIAFILLCYGIVCVLLSCNYSAYLKLDMYSVPLKYVRSCRHCSCALTETPRIL